MDDGPQSQIKTILAVIKSAAIKTSPTIVRWGYAALFVSSIAALILTFFSTDRFQYFIVTVVLVITIAFVLWALDRFIRAKEGWISFIASCAAVLVVLLVISAGLYVMYWAVGIVTRGSPPKPVSNAKATVVSGSEVILSWEPNSSLDEVSVSFSNSPSEKASQVIAKPGSTTLVLKELRPQTKYSFLLRSVSGGLESTPVTVVARTNAIQALFQHTGIHHYSYSYTGQLDQSTGRPSEASTKQDLLINDELKGQVLFRNGEPYGEITLMSVKTSSVCKGSFSDGEPTFTQCQLALALDSKYDGDVRIGSEGSKTAGIAFGPFFVVLHGRGMLFRDKGYVEDGKFADGSLLSGRILGITIGDKGTAQHTILASEKAGAFSKMDDMQVSIGHWENNLQDNGFDIFVQQSQGRSLASIQWHGNTTGQSLGSVPLDRDENCASKDYLDFKKNVVDGQLKYDIRIALPVRLTYGAWSTICDPVNGGPLTCHIYSDALSIIAVKARNDAPKLEIQLAASPSSLHKLTIGNEVFAANGLGRSIRDDAPLAIANMCTQGINIRNPISNKEVSSDGFCKAAAAMFTRLYFCA